MLGFLPEWVSDILILLSFMLGPGGVIWLLLQQRNANRKLKVEEIGADVQSEVNRGSLTVSQFNAALPAYKDLLDRSNKDRDRANAQLEEYKHFLEEVRSKQERLIVLFLNVVERSNIQLTDDELEELEATKPTPWGWKPKTATT